MLEKLDFASQKLSDLDLKTALYHITVRPRYVQNCKISWKSLIFDLSRQKWQKVSNSWKNLLVVDQHQLFSAKITIPKPLVGAGVQNAELDRELAPRAHYSDVSSDFKIEQKSAKNGINHPKIVKNHQKVSNIRNKPLKIIKKFSNNLQKSSKIIKKSQNFRYKIASHECMLTFIQSFSNIFLSKVDFSLTFHFFFQSHIKVAHFTAP